MKFDKNWEKKTTKHVIDLGKLGCPSDINEYMRLHGIEKYLYRFTEGKSIVIKYGMSCATADSARFGDRIYRQVGHMQSWGAARLDGPNGSEFRDIDEEFKNQYGHYIDHKNVELTVWDLTNYQFDTISTTNEIKAMENSLIEAHVNAVGYKPIGNIKDESYIKSTAGIPVDIWNHMFEEVI